MAASVTKPRGSGKPKLSNWASPLPGAQLMETVTLPASRTAPDRARPARPAASRRPEQPRRPGRNRCQPRRPARPWRQADSSSHYRQPSCGHAITRPRRRRATPPCSRAPGNGPQRIHSTAHRRTAAPTGSWFPSAHVVVIVKQSTPRRSRPARRSASTCRPCRLSRWLARPRDPARAAVALPALAARSIPGSSASTSSSACPAC